MEKLKSLSKQVSHTPAAEPWDAGTHFLSLEVSNPFLMSDFPQNWNSRLLVPAEHTDSTVLKTAEVLTKPDLYKRETRTSQGPKEQAPSAGSQGKSTALEAAVQWCPEGQPGMVRTKTNTSAPWALGGTAQGAVTHYESQNNWMKTKPKGIQSSQLRITDVWLGERR